MTDTRIESWLAERKRILAAATEGPWEAEHEEGNIISPTQGNVVEVFSWTEADATAIADAHNHLPALIAMVEAVLGVLNENTPPDPCQPDDPAGMCPDCYLTGEIQRALEAARKAVSGDAE